MTSQIAKRKASEAVRDIIDAARRYVEAEHAFERAIKSGKPARRRRQEKESNCAK